MQPTDTAGKAIRVTLTHDELTNPDITCPAGSHALIVQGAQDEGADGHPDAVVASGVLK
ncbi:hypothetical protein [Streptomyces sp. NPDC059378]|uniref:hypothetical protein n=1 Tax=Streptomyces sp. NPDC059378 TaxID=3346815 RepID=UPI0036C80AAC